MNIDCAPVFLTGNGSLSNKKSSQLLLHRRLTNLGESNTKMRSLSLSGMYDQPLLTIDPANNNLLPSYNVTNHHSSNNNPSQEFIDFNERTKPNSYPKHFAGWNTSTTATTPSKSSRVPDILMINKYYGLVPQKFTISSRKPVAVSSTPSSASSSSRRSTKSNAIKPRAKSSSLQHHHQRQEQRKAKEGKGHRSENDSPEPVIKMVLVTGNGNGSNGFEGRDDKSCMNPFGPVTKRMFVDKKWRNNGGGHKGMNLNMEASIGQTLSLLENGLKSHARKNGNMASADYITNQRVIKIDLNSVSWEGENYEVSPSPEPATMEEKVEKPSEGSDISTSPSIILNGNVSRKGKFTRESSSSTCSLSSFEDNGCFTIWANNDRKPEPPLVNGVHNIERSSSQPEKDENVPGKEMIVDTQQQMGHKQISSTETALPCPKEKVSEGQEDLSGQNAKLGVTTSVIDSSTPKAFLDQKVATMKGRGKLSQRTISFDEKLLEGSSTGLLEDKSENCPTRRRPTTARCNPKTTFNTPNSFNPPSKVIPWTQQKTAGGNPLTLAERRAKFQRVPSVHSSSSLSMDGGEEEVLSEELDSSTSTNCLRPPSSAFKDSRKPLYVMQPPEVPTMISQINPNADEDIQLEIEKVALMLRKMQSLKQFSRSLDSGIETGVLSRAQSVPEGSTLSPNLKTAQLPDKVLLTEGRTETKLENETSLNPSGSESSVSSLDSNSSVEQSQMGNKLKSGSLTEPTKLREGGIDGNLIKRGDPTHANDGSINRQCSKINIAESISTKLNNSSSTSNTIRKTSSLSSASSSPSPLQTGNPSSPIPTLAKTTTVQRPPLKKAISISCEKELLKTAGGFRQNEVNSSANDHGKGGRPKTAGFTSSQRANGTGTRSTQNNNYSQQHHRQSSLSSLESHPAASPAGSQGSRNRKILIKKALMEINQSSVNLRRKWGTLGRPRTAPSSEKNVAHHQGTMSQQQHPNNNAQQRRKPLKASPIAISGDGKIGSSSSGKSSLSSGGTKSGNEMENGKLEKSSSVAGTSAMRANSEGREETGDNNSEQQENGDGSSSYTARGRSKFRQSFSLDESALLGFSRKSVNDGRMPLFERLEESMSASESGSTSILNDEVSFLSSKKREQCLKVYEKMMKTGCAIKLETVFRGMLTPSEYRAFMKAAQKATFEAEEKAREEEEEDDDEEETSDAEEPVVKVEKLHQSFG